MSDVTVRPEDVSLEVPLGRGLVLRNPVLAAKMLMKHSHCLLFGEAGLHLDLPAFLLLSAALLGAVTPPMAKVRTTVPRWRPTSPPAHWVSAATSPNA